MRRSAVALVLVLATPVGGSGGVARNAAALPIGAMDAAIGAAYPLPPIPESLDPEARADWVLQHRVNGRSPSEWLQWARATLPVETPARRSAGDPVAAVARIYRMASLPVPAATVAAIDHAWAGVPADLREPFAALVEAVADEYEAQARIASTVGARLARGSAGDLIGRNELLTRPERDAMAARQARLVAAIGSFGAAVTPRGAEGSDEPIFEDPEGLVVLGGEGDATYERGGLLPDPVLLVDLGGNDTYLNSAGGACPNGVFGSGTQWMTCNTIALSVVADLGDSGDVYSYDGPPAAVQGAGAVGGLGLLVDAGGDDSYASVMTRADSRPIFNYADGGGQGFGYAGAGALLDAGGNDVYRFDVASTHGHSIWALGQGFGGGGGIGLAFDAGGDDTWSSNGLGLSGEGFQGLYTDGVGFYGGTGVLMERGAGNDVYRAVLRAQSVDYYAQGFGAFGGLGILADDGGDDDYYTYQEATGPSSIDPLLNCAFGTGSLGGVGIMLEADGHDSYYGASVSPTGASVMDWGYGGPGQAYGLFVDRAGDDRYVMEAFGSSTMLEGRGLLERDPDGNVHNTFGTFVDLGGNDEYVGGAGGANDSRWVFGVDRS